MKKHIDILNISLLLGQSRNAVWKKINLGEATSYFPPIFLQSFSMVAPYILWSYHGEFMELLWSWLSFDQDKKSRYFSLKKGYI
ncbi:MAG: hypothetical protein WD625_05195 [Balneolales bacterium]